MTQSLIQDFQKGTKAALLKKKIIRLLLCSSTMTISELSKSLDLSVPTVTKFVEELIEDGFVKDCGKLESGGGRHPNLYGLQPNSCYFIGVALTRTEMSIGLINFKGDLVALTENLPATLDNPNLCIEQITQSLLRFMETCGVKKDQIFNVCIGLPGRVNPETGVSHSVLNFKEKPVSEMISKQIGLPVLIENDTRAIAYGEYMRQDGPLPRHFLYVNVNWGLGVAAIFEGKPYYGVSGFTGEFGHNPVYENQIICHCGKKGCIETEVSCTALYRKFIESIKSGENSSVLQKRSKLEDITLDDILEAVHEEDVLAIELVENMGSELGKHIAALINILNPETVVVGGKLAEAGNFLFHPIMSAIRKYSINLMYKDLTVKLPSVPEKAEIIGTCLLARRSVFEA